LFLPPYVGASNTQALFRLCSLARAAQGEIVLDASEVKFVDPLGLAVLGATFEPMFEHMRVRVEWMPVGIAGYLARMGLFARCPFEGVEVPTFRSNDRRSALLELTRISDRRLIGDASRRLAEAITGQFAGVDPNEAPDEMTCVNRFETFAYPLQYMLSELLENALTHARREGAHGATVWVASQYYPSADMVRVAVVDDGCGMLAPLREHWALGSISHASAIAAALRPRISCNRDVGVMADSVNEGVGLTTAHRIAEAAGGRMTIVSGDGRYVSAAHLGTLTSSAFWQGVAVAFSVKRQLLPSINVGQLLPELDVPPVSVRFEDSV
jgi:hypothetical protein